MPAPLSHLPYYLRLCSRLCLTATLFTPTRGQTRGVREARVAPTLPLPSPNAFKAERARERGQVTTHGQRNHSRGTSVPILPARPPDHSDILLSVRPLNRCPLAGCQLPSRGHRDPTRNLRSGRAWNRPPFIKVRRGPTGNTRSSITHYCSHMPTLTRIGNKAAPTTACGRGNLYHTMRIPHDRGTCVTERPSMPTATNWPDQCTPVRTRHTPVPGATPRGPPSRGNNRPSFRQASSGERISEAMRGQPGRAAARSPSL